ncbi:MAG: putative 3-hydroxybutyryl-CoA dehydrogenase [Promethearchaeota archaeon]|nr:MAG: putative 3-hydroxybutyryl-CoA dehydrogenase [Candidatus Lokiarchaeota archaeon]
MKDFKEIDKVSVIGAGTMGREIAQTILLAKIGKVYLNDLKDEVLQEAKQFIQSGFKKLEKKNKLPQGTTSQELLKNLTLEKDLKDTVKDADVVIEAIPEILHLKQQLFQKLGELVSSDTLLASNTSNMKITKIAAHSKKAGNIVGMHFFTPVILLRLIEIIKGKETNEEMVHFAENFALNLPCLKGKRHIIRIEKETPGFIVNRLTAASSIYLNWLLEESFRKDITYEQVGADVVEIQGGGIGPYAKWDYLGLDVILHSFTYFAQELSPYFQPSDYISRLVKENKLGKKTGEGFYKWTKDGKPIVNYSKKANLFDIELFMAIQLNEGCRLLQEQVVEGYKTIDKAIIAGMDMPGPFSAGKRNYENWSEKLIEFVKKSHIEYLYPCKIMESGKFKEMK